MIVSLSGTPGTGKTCIAERFDSTRFEIVSLNALTEDYQSGVDEERGTTEVDIDGLVRDIENGVTSLGDGSGRDVVIEGHLSHLLPADMIIVLRTSTRELEKRLRERSYDDKKIKENMEAEALGVISLEALDTGNPLYEVDTTDLSPDEGASSCMDIIDTCPPSLKGPEELIDYMGEIMEWY